MTDPSRPDETEPTSTDEPALPIEGAEPEDAVGYEDAATEPEPEFESPAAAELEATTVAPIAASTTTPPPAASGRRRRGAPPPARPTAAAATAAHLDDVAYIDDPVAKIWVGAIIAVFAAILVYVLAFGHGGALTPRPTPEPSPSPTPECATPFPSETMFPSESLTSS